MTSREQFEAWYVTVDDRRNLERHADGTFVFAAVERQYLAYAAGQEAMRERVVIVCHEYAADRDVTDGIIDVIRALEIEK